MSAFTEPLAQVREALVRLIAFEESYTGERSPDNDLLPALAQVERRATDMETALRDAEVGFSDISVMIEAENEGFLERAYHRACDEWERARAVLSAREEGADHPVRVIVCGSRSWHDRKPIIDRLADLPRTTTIVHGGAKGADRIAHQEAQKLGLLVEEHDYRPFVGPGTSGKLAPLVRNEHMAKLGADLCIAFWDRQSTGTGHMIGAARAYGIPVEIVEAAR